MKRIRALFSPWRTSCDLHAPAATESEREARWDLETRGREDKQQGKPGVVILIVVLIFIACLHYSLICLLLPGTTVLLIGDDSKRAGGEMKW